MINLGQYNSLAVLRRAEQGFYLGDDSGETVLLPNRYIPEGAAIGDTLSVFIYNDSEDRIIATTLTPKITLNKFASLKVVSVTNHGAFLDWGLAKDIFVPFSEQAVGPMEYGLRNFVRSSMQLVINTKKCFCSGASLRGRFARSNLTDILLRLLRPKAGSQ